MNTRPKVNQVNVPGAGLSPGPCDVSGHLRPVVASCAGAAMTGAPGWRREAGPGAGGGPQRGAAILSRAMRVRWPEGSGACEHEPRRAAARHPKLGIAQDHGSGRGWTVGQETLYFDTETRKALSARPSGPR